MRTSGPFVPLWGLRLCLAWGLAPPSPRTWVCRATGLSWPSGLGMLTQGKQ